MDKKDLSWWTVTETADYIGLSEQHIRSWISRGFLIEGLEYQCIRGVQAHAGKRYLLNSSLFFQFRQGERYITRSETIRIIDYNLRNQVLDEEIENLVLVFASGKRRKFYVLSSVIAYKDKRGDLLYKIFSSRERYLTQDKAADFLGISSERIRQLRIDGFFQGVIKLHVHGHMWWYPFSALEQRLISMGEKNF